MGTGRDLAADLGQMHVHGLAVAARHDQRGAFPLGRTDRTEDPCRCPAQVPRRDRSCASFGPAACDLRLLAEPGFILPPQLYGRAFGQAFADLRQTGGEGFLKAAMSSGRCPRWRGRAESLR